MGGHAERPHSLLSPSNAYQWMACTPSALLGRQFPDTSSPAAAEGTLAHELAELKVKNYFYTVDFGKRKLSNAINRLKKEELWQDEMMGYTDDYLDYIKSVAMKYSSNPYVAIEKRVNLGTYIPHLPDEEETGGTADCILIGGNILHVIDFKYGKSPDGRVSAEWNPQMLLYALGAYEAYRLLYKVETIRLSIVQPRLSDGISEWECTLDEMLQFGKFVQERATLAIKGEGEFKPALKTCKYCRAKGRCRAWTEFNRKLVFSPGYGKLPPLLTNEELGKYLKEGAGLVKWYSDMQDVALKECLAGKEVPGWKAVEGRGSRDWTDMDMAFGRLTENGIDDTVLWERKPLTLAQVEKVVGRKDFQELVGDLVIKKPGKPALVEESDKREAITNKVTAAEAFKEENNYE